MVFKKLLKITLLISLIFLQTSAKADQKILVVQSMKFKPYEEALKGFKMTCKCDVNEIFITDIDQTDVVKEVRKTIPTIILAIGIDALAKVKRIKDTPIIYLMVPNPGQELSGEQNITGVNISIPPEKHLKTLKEVQLHDKRVGLLYNPRKTGHFVKRAEKIAHTMGINLITKQVNSSKDIPKLLARMKHKIDLFWMIPDPTVITPETVTYLFYFSIDNKIPVLTFSEKYLNIGAFMSISIDPFDLGKQAGEIAKKILSGTNVRNISAVEARTAVTSVNMTVAKKMGIIINDTMSKKFRIFEQSKGE